MSVALMMELMSQADAEGVTLSEIVARKLSLEEMDRAQVDLQRKLSENYRRIEEFMSTISVPSIDEVLAMDESERGALLSEQELTV